MGHKFIFITMIAYIICFIVIQNYIPLTDVQFFLIWVMIGLMNLLGYIEGKLR